MISLSNKVPPTQPPQHVSHRAGCTSPPHPLKTSVAGRLNREVARQQHGACCEDRWVCSWDVINVTSMTALNLSLLYHPSHATHVCRLRVSYPCAHSLISDIPPVPYVPSVVTAAGRFQNNSRTNHCTLSALHVQTAPCHGIV